MSIALVLGMFPGFMSMVTIYIMFDLVHLNQTLTGLILAYSIGSGAGFFVAKGFFDTIPRAIAVDEKTPIIVSVEIEFFFSIHQIPIANMIPKIIIDVNSSILKIMPNAIPVNAECPNASEKKDNLLFTIIVPIIPNKGAIIINANNAACS